MSTLATSTINYYTIAEATVASENTIVCAEIIFDVKNFSKEILYNIRECRSIINLNSNNYKTYINFSISSDSDKDAVIAVKIWLDPTIEKPSFVNLSSADEVGISLNEFLRSGEKTLSVKVQLPVELTENKEECRASVYLRGWKASTSPVVTLNDIEQSKWPFTLDAAQKLMFPDLGGQKYETYRNKIIHDYAILDMDNLHNVIFLTYWGLKSQGTLSESYNQRNTVVGVGTRSHWDLGTECNLSTKEVIMNLPTYAQQEYHSERAVLSGSEICFDNFIKGSVLSPPEAFQDWVQYFVNSRGIRCDDVPSYEEFSYFELSAVSSLTDNASKITASFTIENVDSNTLYLLPNDNITIESISGSNSGILSRVGNKITYATGSGNNEELTFELSGTSALRLSEEKTNLIKFFIDKKIFNNDGVSEKIYFPSSASLKDNSIRFVSTDTGLETVHHLTSSGDTGLRFCNNLSHTSNYAHQDWQQGDYDVLYYVKKEYDEDGESVFSLNVVSEDLITSFSCTVSLSDYETLERVTPTVDESINPSVTELTISQLDGRDWSISYVPTPSIDKNDIKLFYFKLNNHLNTDDSGAVYPISFLDNGTFDEWARPLTSPLPLDNTEVSNHIDFSTCTSKDIYTLSKIDTDADIESDGTYKRALIKSGKTLTTEVPVSLVRDEANLISMVIKIPQITNNTRAQINIYPYEIYLGAPGANGDDASSPTIMVKHGTTEVLHAVSADVFVKNMCLTIWHDGRYLNVRTNGKTTSAKGTFQGTSSAHKIECLEPDPNFYYELAEVVTAKVKSFTLDRKGSIDRIISLEGFLGNKWGFQKCLTNNIHSDGILFERLYRPIHFNQAELLVNYFQRGKGWPNEVNLHTDSQETKKKFYIQNISVNGSDKNSFENPCFAKPAEQTRKIYLKYFEDGEEIWADFSDDDISAFIIDFEYPIQSERISIGDYFSHKISDDRKRIIFFPWKQKEFKPVIATSPPKKIATMKFAKNSIVAWQAANNLNYVSYANKDVFEQVLRSLLLKKTTFDVTNLVASLQKGTKPELIQSGTVATPTVSYSIVENCASGNNDLAVTVNFAGDTNKKYLFSDEIISSTTEDLDFSVPASCEDIIQKHWVLEGPDGAAIRGVVSVVVPDSCLPSLISPVQQNISYNVEEKLDFSSYSGSLYELDFDSEKVKINNIYSQNGAFTVKALEAGIEVVGTLKVNYGNGCSSITTVTLNSQTYASTVIESFDVVNCDYDCQYEVNLCWPLSEVGTSKYKINFNGSEETVTYSSQECDDKACYVKYVDVSDSEQNISYTITPIVGTTESTSVMTGEVSLPAVVRPSVPEETIIVSSASNPPQIDLQWSPITEAYAYSVWRKYPWQTSWQRLEVLSGAATTSYTDDSIEYIYGCGEVYSVEYRVSSIGEKCSSGNPNGSWVPGSSDVVATLEKIPLPPILPAEISTDFCTDFPVSGTLSGLTGRLVPGETRWVVSGSGLSGFTVTEATGDWSYDASAGSDQQVNVYAVNCELSSSYVTLNFVYDASCQFMGCPSEEKQLEDMNLCRYGVVNSEYGGPDPIPFAKRERNAANIRESETDYEVISRNATN